MTYWNRVRESRVARRVAYVVIPLGVVLATAAIVRASGLTVFNPGDKLDSQKMNANFSSLDMRLAALETAPAVPPGTIVAFGGEKAPPGWLPCDGTPLDGTNAKFANLYAAIGTSFGGNTTSMQFNLPDLRGRFVRGWDSSIGHDPDAGGRTALNAGGATSNHVGSFQSDALQAHQHADAGHQHSDTYTGWTGGSQIDAQYTAAPSGGGYGLWTKGTSTGVGNAQITNPTTGRISSETRPANVAVNYIIKL